MLLRNDYAVHDLVEWTLLASTPLLGLLMISRLPYLHLLNRYLGAMTDIILAHQGTIDEFIGDAILAVFGAPQTREDDADRAVQCALAMQAAMADINRANEADGLPAVATGIALNTGKVIAGNIGSERRASYGAVGTPINAAYRIESFTVGGQILISPTTHERIGTKLAIIGTKEVKFKGLDQPVCLYDVAGIGDPYQVFLPAKKEKNF